MEARISVGAEDSDKVTDLFAWFTNAPVEGATVELRDAEHGPKREGHARIISAVRDAATIVPLVLAIHGWILERAPEVEVEVEVDEIKLKVKATNTDKVVRRIERWIRMSPW